MHAEQPDEFAKNSTDLISMIGRATASARNQYLEQIKSALQKIDNHKFEDIIGELFIKNGYTLTDNNWYDGEGGDVDLVFECFNRNTLMYNIYEICDVKMPHIYVQAKKKTGKDIGDIVGVDQLVKMEERIPEKNAILMVINLTDEFSDEAKEKADENGIILINGLTFASLLVRAIGSILTVTRKIDTILRYRFRMCIWKHWKTPQNKYKNLVKLGVEPRNATRAAWSHGYARICRTETVCYAMSNARLARFGLLSAEAYFVKVSS